MSKCFSCGEGMPRNTQQRIQYYKEIAEKTGENYVFFKTESGAIGITQSKGFKPKKGQEYALVTEFGQKTTDFIPTENEQQQINEIQVAGHISDSGMVENTQQRTGTAKRNKRK